MKNRVSNCMVPMTDGIRLYTETILPEKGTKFPVILVRTPYAPGKSDIAGLQNIDTHGYARVHQHCRGCGESEGECIPYINERQDGLALLEWVRKQDFYNGEIFLDGSSYLSSVHYSYLNTRQPDIKGAFFAVQDSERYNIIYRNGFFKPGLHGNWAVKMYKRNSLKKRDIVPETWLTYPLSGITKHIFGETDEQLEEEMRHPDPADEFWQTAAGGADYSGVTEKCDFPILLTTSAFDIYTGGVLDMWKKIPLEKRKNCALAVSPFAHNFDVANPEGLPQFPEGRLSDKEPDYIYRWFDYCQKGRKPDFIEPGKMIYYSLFENHWHYADDFPEGDSVKELYFTTERKLTGKIPDNEGEIIYCYNPYAPAKFKGGCCHNFDGMRLQDEPNSRYDIISFVSGEMEEIDCCGTMELTLPVKSTAPDSCFYARIDIIRDGKCYCLRDEIDSLCRNYPEYRPGEKVVLTFKFVPISFRIQAGDKIRVDISSSCFPYFIPHPNRKGLMVEQTGADIADNTICCDGAKLTLPRR